MNSNDNNETDKNGEFLYATVSFDYVDIGRIPSGINFKEEIIVY